ncbi:DUF397 domain-containing protein [Actinomadura adrarensis]|uniref:DUF397 domain-containing protein n=1 Tax=Actinomadura adrarensis TaxID=1819600 RepID=A0ABW3C8X5_9ACTN
MSGIEIHVGARWRKASRSTGSGEDCVEVAATADLVAVRDSKDPDGPRLIVGRESWREFARRVSAGELDVR